MKFFRPILLKLYVFLIVGLTLFCHAKNKQADPSNGGGNTPNSNCNAQNPYQFGVDFGDFQALTANQIEQAVKIARANCIKLIRVYDQLQSDENWQKLMDTCNDDIKVIVGISNNYLYTNHKTIATSISNFVQKYIIPYQSKIQTILVGNELNNDPNGVELIQKYLNSYIGELSQALSNANINIGLSIGGAGPHGNDGDIGPFYNLGYCALNPNLVPAVTLISQQSKNKLFLNIYPYFTPNKDSNGKSVILKNTDIYGNFNGCLQTFKTSLNNAGITTINPSNIVIGETGWSSSGENPGLQPSSLNKTNANLNCIMAGVYNSKDIEKPNQVLFFEFFDEIKGSESENNFGLFTNLNLKPSDNPGPGTLKKGINLNFNNPANATCPN